MRKRVRSEMTMHAARSMQSAAKAAPRNTAVGLVVGLVLASSFSNLVVAAFQMKYLKRNPSARLADEWLDSSMVHRTRCSALSSVRQDASTPPGALGNDNGENQEEVYQPETARRPMTMMEMSAVGMLFSASIVLTLAMNRDMALGDGDNLIRIVPTANDLGVMADNLIDASLPTSIPDTLAVTVGEGVAGLLGATASFALSSTMMWQQQAAKAAPRVGDVVAESDYFLALAAAEPLFEAAGLPPIVASVVSVVLASVPYEVIKIGSRRRETRLVVDKIMQKLLEEQKSKEQTQDGIASRLMSYMKDGGNTGSKNRPTVDLASLVPVSDESEELDFVEIFTDVTKWLEFKVLKSELSGWLASTGLPAFPGFESALFGLMATLSAQLYADILYYYFGFGSQQQQQEVQSRSVADWSALYLTRCITAATLFGVYDVSLIPVRSFISDLISGGVEGCVGSANFDQCSATYILDNPPVDSAGGELRELVDSIANIWTDVINHV